MFSPVSFNFSSSWFFISRRTTFLPLRDCMVKPWPFMFNVLVLLLVGLSLKSSGLSLCIMYIFMVFSWFPVVLFG